MKKQSIFKILLFLILCFNAQISNANYNNSITDTTPEYYDTNQYNIFNAPLWVLEPYIHLGYSFSLVNFHDTGRIPYKEILSRPQHGLNVGIGFFINHNWGFGISFNYFTKENRNYYQQLNFDKIRQNILLLNFDFSLRLPFTFQGMRTYVITGMNVIFANLEHNYKTKQVMVETTQMNKTSFGLNLGLGLEYRVIEHIFVNFEVRRIFVLSKAIINNFWLFNTGLMIKF